MLWGESWKFFNVVKIHYCLGAIILHSKHTIPNWFRGTDTNFRILSLTWEQKIATTQHLSLTLPNFNCSNGTVVLINFLTVCPLYPIGTDFPLHLHLLVDTPTNSSSSRVWSENNFQQYNHFALATGWTLIRCFCLCARYTPKRRVILMK